jgi:hypothetical protein
MRGALGSAALIWQRGTGQENFSARLALAN